MGEVLTEMSQKQIFGKKALISQKYDQKYTFVSFIGLCVPFIKIFPRLKISFSANLNLNCNDKS